MIRCLKTDLYRALFNFKFVIIVLCIAIIPFLGASGTGGIDLSILAKGDSIFDCLYYALVMSHFGIMVFIFTALTFFWLSVWWFKLQKLFIQCHPKWKKYIHSFKNYYCSSISNCVIYVRNDIVCLYVKNVLQI